MRARHRSIWARQNGQIFFEIALTVQPIVRLRSSIVVVAREAFRMK